MNAVEIEETITAVAEQPYATVEFPFGFLEVFGNKKMTIKRLGSGSSNKSELNGILQANNIHIKACDVGEVTKTIQALEASPATTKAKTKLELVTDGVDLEAENLKSGETIACVHQESPDHFGFFLTVWLSWGTDKPVFFCGSFHESL